MTYNTIVGTRSQTRRLKIYVYGCQDVKREVYTTQFTDINRTKSPQYRSSYCIQPLAFTVTEKRLWVLHFEYLNYNIACHDIKDALKFHQEDKLQAFKGFLDIENNIMIDFEGSV